MVLFIKKRTMRIFCFLLIILSFWTVFVLTNRITPLPVFYSTSDNLDQTVIIDAGHGGEDGGAVSLSGMKESDINLSISLRLDELLHFCGVTTKMTRVDDRSLHDSSATTLRQKKVSDLKNRVTFVENEENPVLISIHQNSFPGAVCNGLQTFYRDDNSLSLSKQIQDNMQRCFDPENERKPMKVPDSVYLMKHISCEAVIVECGFLSSHKDNARLQEDDYQKQLAVAIASAYCSQTNT